MEPVIVKYRGAGYVHPAYVTASYGHIVYTVPYDNSQKDLGNFVGAMHLLVRNIGIEPLRDYIYDKDKRECHFFGE